MSRLHAFSPTVVLLSRFIMSFTGSLTEHITTAGRPHLGSSSTESRPLLKRTCHLYTVAGLHCLCLPVDSIMFIVFVGDFSTTQNFPTSCLEQSLRKLSVQWKLMFKLDISLYFLTYSERSKIFNIKTKLPSEHDISYIHIVMSWLRGLEKVSFLM